jgi:hypothetical protein
MRQTGLVADHRRGGKQPVAHGKIDCIDRGIREFDIKNITVTPIIDRHSSSSFVAGFKCGFLLMSYNADN